MSDAIELHEALLLGAVQGATEFLPISSSGHIAIGSALFGMREAPLALSVMLHVGTLAATAVHFRREIAALAGQALAVVGIGDRDRLDPLLGKLVVATLPTVAIALLLRPRLTAWTGQLALVGACLLISAAAVAVTRYVEPRSETIGWRQAVWVGVAQGIAVMPGISRSGATIATAMALGVRGPEAFRFSFLLSLPAISGAALLELGDPTVLATLGVEGLLGALTAFITGYLALLLLQRTIQLGRLWAFAFYLVPLGVGLIYMECV